MGRSKIPITWIKSDASRQVTFNKRKKGMKKKAEELAILCGVDVCMICYGPTITGKQNNHQQQQQQSQSSAGSPSSSSASASTTANIPFSWGMPGVSTVIGKFEGLPKEERDKKKLDNTSLLEQQIKKLRRELKTKLDQNWKLEQERAYFAWDDRLDCYTVEELKRLADCLLEKLRLTFERMTYWEQQQQHQQQQQDQQQQQQQLVVHGGNPSEMENVADHEESMVFSSKQVPPSFLPFLPVNPFVLPSQQHYSSDVSLNPMAISQQDMRTGINMRDLGGFAAHPGPGYMEDVHNLLPLGIGPSHMMSNWKDASTWSCSSEAVITSTYPCRMNKHVEESADPQGNWGQSCEAAGASILQHMLLSAINESEVNSDESRADHGDAFRIHHLHQAEDEYDQ